jgi:hypothetical protein
MLLDNGFPIPGKGGQTVAFFYTASAEAPSAKHLAKFTLKKNPA